MTPGRQDRLRRRRAWTALKRALSPPWGPGDFEPRGQAVDDPSWAGLTTADVLAAVSADDEPAVVLLADGVGLRTGQGALPAVSTLTAEAAPEGAFRFLRPARDVFLQPARGVSL
ncbi:DUF6924 domain-containing protein [Streptomyces mirabilis]|uniref:DUF6924 domain-containing protein n=1 Tax=Streptomyces mirabilis TaxID=68239 RepID=UPI0036884151